MPTPRRSANSVSSADESLANTDESQAKTNVQNQAKNDQATADLLEEQLGFAPGSNRPYGGRPASFALTGKKKKKKKRPPTYWEIAAETMAVGTWNADKAVQRIWGHNQVDTQLHGDGLLVIDRKNNEVFCYSASPEVMNRLIEIAIKQISDPETGGLDPWASVLFIDAPTPGSKGMIRGILDSRSIYYVFNDEYEKDPAKFAGQFHHSNRKKRDALVQNGTKFLNEYYLWLERPGNKDGNNLSRTAPGEIIDDRICFNPVKTPVVRWPQIDAKGVAWPTANELKGWLARGDFQQHYKDGYDSYLAAFNADQRNITSGKTPEPMVDFTKKNLSWNDVKNAFTMIQEACRADPNHELADKLQDEMGIVMPGSFNYMEGKFIFDQPQRKLTAAEKAEKIRLHEEWKAQQQGGAPSAPRGPPGPRP